MRIRTAGAIWQRRTINLYGREKEVKRVTPLQKLKTVPSGLRCNDVTFNIFNSHENEPPHRRFEPIAICP
jgi:hypothetical protein